MVSIASQSESAFYFTNFYDNGIGSHPRWVGKLYSYI